MTSKKHLDTDQQQGLQFRVMTAADLDLVAELANKLHPHLDLAIVRAYMEEMFEFPTYYCFGLMQGDRLVAVSNGWITVRIYSGKQLEVDNVIVDPDQRSQGLGKAFFARIQQWAQENGCRTIELNTFVQNSKSHKFYFNEGYKILGFHFQKSI